MVDYNASKACIALLAAALLATAAVDARATEWPTRPVTVIVPYPAGGNTDTMARIAGARLGARLGQTFIIDNRGGANGIPATAQVAKAAPDGYTVEFGAATQFIIMPMLQKVGYDPERDFVPVGIVGAGAYILGVRASLPVNTLPELIAYAKANPGKLNYGTAGTGGIIHLASALLAAKAGIEMVQVPYKGGGPAVMAFVAGEVDLYFGNASEMISQAASGKIRLLAVSAEKRLPAFPNMPTVSEFFPGFKITSWNGFLAPVATPPAIVERLADAVAAVVKEPDVVKRLSDLGIAPSGLTTTRMGDLIAGERIFYAEAIKAAGIKRE
ncbi:MAG: tripartite tricarboxylate transporter substrate binding protein [Xanthobacteraceae bacterium]|nr:tripartite tricarboxylate transporter substrate binding protein [Xanthobacteraceae bacterium]